MIKERPILFSELMVRAILDGRKTQTRRILKKSTENKGPYNPAYLEVHKNSKGWKEICPYGKIGDQLWVRETWGRTCGTIIHRADDSDFAMDLREDEQKWKPSIHMRREYSRIDLKIKDIWIEQLQDINELDAKSEGVEPNSSHSPSDHIAAFADLWMQINGGTSWSENPWVWVIKFERIKP